MFLNRILPFTNSEKNILDLIESKRLKLTDRGMSDSARSAIKKELDCLDQFIDTGDDLLTDLVNENKSLKNQVAYLSDRVRKIELYMRSKNLDTSLLPWIGDFTMAQKYI